MLVSLILSCFFSILYFSFVLSLFLLNNCKRRQICFTKSSTSNRYVLPVVLEHVPKHKNTFSEHIRNIVFLRRPYFFFICGKSNALSLRKPSHPYIKFNCHLYLPFSQFQSVASLTWLLSLPAARRYSMVEGMRQPQ